MKFIRLTSPGKNALDFALAFYLGQAAASDPAASFHLVSKDTGYDNRTSNLAPLERHFTARHAIDSSAIAVWNIRTPALAN